MQERRIGVLLAFGFLLIVGLVARLFSISVVQHDAYLAQAKDQQTEERQVLPRRGDIYVRDHTTGKAIIIAQSVERFSLSATPLNVVKKSQYAKLLAEVSGGNEAEIKKALDSDKKYMNTLKHDLSQEEIEAIATKINALERADNPKWVDVKISFAESQGDVLYFVGGVYFRKEYQRVYPEGGLLGQVLGFVNDFGQGQYGFEGQYDSELKGYAGSLQIETDSVGTSLGQNVSVEGKDGSNYELTIDRNIQYEVERQLAAAVKDAEAEGGSVIIIEPKTGEIIAMASSPSYNPNNFREIKPTEIGLFDNPVISRIWEPGSIFKPLVMAAALDMGLVKPETKETFPESVMVGSHKIETALRKAYGEETMTQVLANSDNVAMVWVANKLGNQNMHNYLSKFGFGEYTEIDLKNEISGNLPPLKQWRDINRATISFGQGIAVTPMQVATAYAAIANDGKLVRPRIVHAVDNQVLAPTFGAQVVKPEIAKQLRDMMVATVVFAHNRAGTPGYKIGGKTGTAQIPDATKGGYLEDAYNHSFVGIGPSDDPRYVMLVKIDHPNLKKVGIYAEGTAVPLFGKLSTFLLNYYQIQPTNR